MSCRRSHGLRPILSAWLTCISTAIAPVAAAQSQPLEPAPALRSDAPAKGATTQPGPATSASPEPAPRVQSEYRDVVTRAIAEFGAGRFAEARALFLRAHELWPSARTFRTLGMTAFELRMYPLALVELQAALDDPRRPLEGAQHEQVQALIERTRAFVGRYRLRLSPAETELLVDGAPFAANAGPLVLAVGDHFLVARARGHGELRRSLVVQGREDEELPLRLEPATPAAVAMVRKPVRAAPPVEPARTTRAASKPNRTPAWITFGVAAAGVVVGTATGIVALNKKHEDQATGKQVADVSTGAFIVAGVGAAVGTILWITATAPDATHEHASASHAASGRFIRPVIGLGVIGVEGQL